MAALGGDWPHNIHLNDVSLAAVMQEFLLRWCLEKNSTEGEKADICLTGKQKTHKAGLFY